MPASAGLVALAVMGGATERLECEREITRRWRRRRRRGRRLAGVVRTVFLPLNPQADGVRFDALLCRFRWNNTLSNDAGDGEGSAQAQKAADFILGNQRLCKAVQQTEVWTGFLGIWPSLGA